MQPVALSLVQRGGHTYGHEGGIAQAPDGRVRLLGMVRGADLESLLAPAVWRDRLEAG
jgi:hypothetical protein